MSVLVCGNYNGHTTVLQNSIQRFLTSITVWYVTFCFKLIDNNVIECSISLQACITPPPCFCLHYLWFFFCPAGLNEIGIFRLPGQASRIQTLKEVYDQGTCGVSIIL